MKTEQFKGFVPVANRPRRDYRLKEFLQKLRESLYVSKAAKKQRKSRTNTHIRFTHKAWRSLLDIATLNCFLNRWLRSRMYMWRISLEERPAIQRLLQHIGVNSTEGREFIKDADVETNEIPLTEESPKAVKTRLEATSKKKTKDGGDEYEEIVPLAKDAFKHVRTVIRFIQYE